LYITQSNTFFSATLYFRLYLPNAEMTLDLEVNEVEVKVLTSLASVTEITADVKEILNCCLDHLRELKSRIGEIRTSR
jgi:hypothetical protein